MRGGRTARGVAVLMLGVTLPLVLFYVLVSDSILAIPRFKVHDRRQTSSDIAQFLASLKEGQLVIPDSLAKREAQRRTDAILSLTSLPDFESLFYKVNVLEEIKSSVIGSPLDPLPGFKNPCWVGSVDLLRAYTNNPRLQNRHTFTEAMTQTLRSHILRADKTAWRMRCFPYAMLVGVSKCGTTDLFDRLVKHPQIQQPFTKETRFWNRQRIGRLRLAASVNLTFTNFIDFFDNASNNVLNDIITREPAPIGYHGDIIMEGTPHYLWDYEGWENIPGNRGLREPRFILAHSLHSLNTDLKIVVILRDPTARLYSQFRMLSRSSTPATFHELVMTSLKLWRDCLKHNSIRGCAYNAILMPHEYSHPGGMTLRAGLYHIFLEDWFRVFPKEQFHIVRGEDYYGNMTFSLQSVHRFLGVTSLPDEIYREIVTGKVKNSNDNRKRSVSADMFQETKEILDNFYRPFNEKLAKLIGDHFIWSDS